jgi:hypothetical protein
MLSLILAYLKGKGAESEEAAGTREQRQPEHEMKSKYLTSGSYGRINVGGNEIGG